MSENPFEPKTIRCEIDITLGTCFSIALLLFIVFAWKESEIWQIIAIGALHGAAIAMSVKAALGNTKTRLTALQKNNEQLRAKSIKIENMLRQSIKSQTSMAKQLLANEEYVVSIMDNYEALIAKCKEAGVDVEDHWNADVEKAFKDMRAVCAKTSEALKKVL